MTLNDPFGQQVPIEEEEGTISRVEETVRAMEGNKKAVISWSLRGVLLLNLILASAVFWLVVIPSLL